MERGREMEKKREWIRLEGRCRVEDGISRQFVPNCPCTRLFSYFTLIFLTFCDFFFFLLPIVHSFTLSHSRALTHTSQIRSAAPGASFSRPRNQTVKQSCPYSRSWHIPSCVLYFWAQIPLTVLVCVCVQLTLRNSLQPLGLYQSMFAWCCIQAKQGPLGLLYVCVSMAFLCVTSNKWDAFVFGLLCLVPVLSCTPCMFISCQF